MSTLIQISNPQNPIVLTMDGNPVAGTIAETDCSIIRVDPGQLNSRDMFTTLAKHNIIATTGTSIYRLYYNNVPTFVGGSLIATSSALTPGLNSGSFSRFFTISGTNIIGADPIGQVETDYNQTDDAITFIDLTNTMYFIFTIENSDVSIIADVPKFVIQIFK
jgi:hypothetical protein